MLECEYLHCTHGETESWQKELHDPQLARGRARLQAVCWLPALVLASAPVQVGAGPRQAGMREVGVWINPEPANAPGWLHHGFAAFPISKVVLAYCRKCARLKTE